MPQYLMLFTPYEPESYTGHRIYSISAPNMEEAEKIGHEWLEERNLLTISHLDKFEYMIVEVATKTSFRVYSTEQKKRL